MTIGALSPAAPRGWSRRQVIGALPALPLGAGLPVRAKAAEALRIGQSGMLSGPLADLGQAMSQGANACFASINAQGGVGGRLIELVTLDDAYDVKRAVANVDRLLADRSVFALLSCMGTPMVEAMLPKVIESGIPFFAPYTGALVARPKGVRSIFNVRPSYPEEADRLVEHLAAIGIKRIAVVYQNNTFGKEIWDGARAALARYKLTSTAVATVETDASDAVDAAAKVIEAQPEAVLAGVAGKPTVALVRALRSMRRGLPIYALSIFGASSTLNALGDDAIGITVSQVMPYPLAPAVPVVRDFRRDWQANSTTLEPSYTALEGYINARVFIEALRRAGVDATRSSFIDSTWNIKNLDLGGFKVSFTEPGRNASSYIDITMVQRGGRFLR